MKQIGELGKALSINKNGTNTQEAWGWLVVRKNKTVQRYGYAESIIGRNEWKRTSITREE